MAETRWTPTPWEAIGKAVYAADGTEVVHACKGGDPEANALRIVRAVNSHDDLCEALENVEAELAEPRMIAVAIPGMREMVRAALARARGEGADDG